VNVVGKTRYQAVAIFAKGVGDSDGCDGNDSGGSNHRGDGKDKLDSARLNRIRLGKGGVDESDSEGRGWKQGT
jgi:hypothetical protein